MSVLRDLADTFRQLRRAPGFALSACCLLAFGISISVAMFSLLRGVLLVALPYPDATQLVQVTGSNLRDTQELAPLTAGEALALTEMAQTKGGALQQFGYYNWGGMTLFDGEHPRETSVALVSHGFFPTLATQPQLGRWFAAQEHQSDDKVVVLSHSEWQRLLGGRSDVIGTLVDTSEGRLRVIGVMPPSFAYPADVVGAWLPRAPYRGMSAGVAQPRFVFGIGRRSADSSMAALNAQLAALAQTQNSSDAQWTLAAQGVLEALVGDLRGSLWSAFAIAVLVLLIAAVNVTILFDTRQLQRLQARSVAQALGASPQRLWWMQVLELTVLCVIGGSLGVLLAWTGLEQVRELARNSLPRVDEIALDGSVLLFAAALIAALPLLVGLITLPRSSPPTALVLRGGRGLLGGRAGWRRFLPAVAVGLSTTSLVAATALGLSLKRLQEVDPGFDPQQVHGLQLFRPGSPEQLRGFVDSVSAGLAALPGVTQVSYSAAPPLAVSDSLAVELRVAGRAEPEPYRAGLRRVGPDYLSLMRTPLLAGRQIDARDQAGSEAVAVISAELARRSFPGTDPLGQMLQLEQGQVRVVGVMGDTRNAGLRAAPSPEMLLPYAQAPAPALTLLVRSNGQYRLSERELGAPVWSADARQAVYRQFQLAQDLGGQLSTTRFFASALSMFAIAAFVLAALGVYAVAALQQRQRSREFGLRAAIGARASSLAWRVLGSGLRDVLPGALLGSLGAVFALQLLCEQLYALDNQLTWLTAACACAMLGVALLALLLPAWRAARIDPMRILRSE